MQLKVFVIGDQHSCLSSEFPVPAWHIKPVAKGASLDQCRMEHVAGQFHGVDVKISLPGLKLTSPTNMEFEATRPCYKKRQASLTASSNSSVLGQVLPLASLRKKRIEEDGAVAQPAAADGTIKAKGNKDKTKDNTVLHLLR